MKELQKKLVELQSKVKSTKDKRNNFGNFNYRSVEDIYEAVKPILKELELTLTLSDDISLIGDRFYIVATATLSDGENKIEVKALARESVDKRGMDTAQVTGSTSSYARKYALGGLLLLDDNKDIDSDDNSDNHKPVPKANNDTRLVELKKQVASTLKQYNIKPAEFVQFFEFVSINKDSIEDLEKLMKLDFAIMTNDFLNRGDK